MENETSIGHKKHADLQRPALGYYGRLEIGLIGAPCNVISDLVHVVSDQLSDRHEICYVDADHHADKSSSVSNLNDKINYHRVDYNRKLNEYDLKLLLNDFDILLVNSNHFLSNEQIVFCTEKKKESLFKKLDRLTDVGLILLDEGIQEPHDFLKNHLQNFQNIPILKISDHDKIIAWIKEKLNSRIAKIKGLVLAGGKSQRMGEDKALLQYHAQPQMYHACQILEELNIPAHLSMRERHNEQLNDRYPVIYDVFEGLGPFGGILSAFRHDPNSAWLVTACDQPLITQNELSRLIEERDPSKLATCFHNPETKFPEPLITLWEPKAYLRLLSFLSLGYSCPRKVLINSEIKEIHSEDNVFMKNANTPEERTELQRIIAQS